MHASQPTLPISFSDKVMNELHQKVLTQIGPIPMLLPRHPDDFFWDLCESILGQQLSEKVAPQIIARVKTTLDQQLTPDRILATDDTALRAAGVSFAKASYLKNVAQAWQTGTIDPHALLELNDEEVIQLLTQIKGVGRWTAEMFLIFTLARPDVFSVGDYGLKRAMILTYQLQPDTKANRFLELSQGWAPHRSLASRILWKSLTLPQQSTL